MTKDSPVIDAGAAPAFGQETLPLFFLDPDVLHLNHGSYGAVPRSVLNAQQTYREEAERRCSSFHRDDYYQRLDRNRRIAADRLGGEAKDWVFVENATAACNAILLSQDLRPGDEVLFLSAIYGAIRKALIHWLGRRDITLTELAVPLPAEGPEQIADLVQDALSDRTKLLVLDHITSITALLMPVAEIAALCRKNGTRVLIDGAHMPGQLPLDVAGLGVDYYTGNAHKWLFAPKGCGLLWVRPDLQDATHPVVISHGYRAGLTKEFDWIGTRDASAWFSLGDAVAAHDAFGGQALMDRNRLLAAEAGDLVAKAIGGTLAGPPEMRAAMATILIPGTTGRTDTDAVQRDFARLHNMETSFVPWEDQLAIRLSAQVYNALPDYEALSAALTRYFELP